MFEIIRTIGYLQKLLVTQHRMQVTDIEDGLRVLVFGGYEEIQKIAKEVNAKLNINYIEKLDQYEVFVQVDEITFITYLLPGEIEKYEMEGKTWNIQ